MGFVDALRMNNIYPPNGSGVPVVKPIDLGSTLGTMTSNIENLQDRNESRRRDAMAFNANFNNNVSHLNAAPPTPPMNTVVQPDTGDSFGMLNNLRNLSQGTEKERIAQGQNEAKVEAAGAKNDVQWDKNDIARSRADVYAWKEQHPKWTSYAGKGGTLVFVNPEDPNQVVDTGIDSGTMSDADRMNLTGQQKLNQIDETNGGRAQIQQMRGNQQLANIGARTAAATSLAENKPTHQLPSQDRVAQTNNARQLKNTNPDLAKYVQFNSDGSFSITPPSDGGYFGSGPTADQFKQINDQIYGGNRSFNDRSSNTPSMPGVPDGRIIVRDRNGNIAGHIPNTPEQIDMAKKQGYTVDPGGGEDNQ